MRAVLSADFDDCRGELAVHEGWKTTLALRIAQTLSIFLSLGLPLALLVAPTAEAAPKARSTSLIPADTAPYSVADPALPSAKNNTPKPSHLLMLSIDGVAYPTLRRYLPRLPHLRSLARRGFFRSMQTVFPSVTWAAHVSAVTGQYPRVHGVLGNRWVEKGHIVRPYLGETTDRDRQLRTPSLYDIASLRGWDSAALNWPGTQRSTTLTYNLPETMHGAWLVPKLVSARLWPTLRAALRSRYRIKRFSRARRKLGKILSREGLAADRLITDVAIKLVRERRDVPKLMLVHLVSADTLQHAYGMRTKRLAHQLEALDRQVGRLLHAYRRRGLLSRTAILVFSDHGFANTRRVMDLRYLLYRKGLARSNKVPDSRKPRPNQVITVYNGHVAYIYVPRDAHRKTRAIATLLKRRQYKRCVRAVYTPKQYVKLGLPAPVELDAEGQQDDDAQHQALGQHPAAPSLVVMAHPHCAFMGNPGRVIRETRFQFGTHGYLPTHRSLMAFLLGAGPGIKAANPQKSKGAAAKPLPQCRIVDVAPTAAHLLGLSWPRTFRGSKRRFRLDGRVLTDVLSSTRR
jgi:hypothetical protein